VVRIEVFAMHRFRRVGFLALVALALTGCGAVALADATATPSITSSTTATAAPTASPSPTQTVATIPGTSLYSIPVPGIPSGQIFSPSISYFALTTAALATPPVAESAALSAATAEAPQIVDPTRYSYSLESTSLAEIGQSADGSDASLYWVFVYSSVEPMTVKNSMGGNDVGGATEDGEGHQFVVTINATTGQWSDIIGSAVVS
jgi:hypothetical protein